MQCAPSRSLSGLQRFVPASAAALFVSIALISPCQAGPEFTAVNVVSAPVSTQSADKRSATPSASMQTFGALVSAKPATQPLDRSYASSVDLGTGDLSAGAFRSMPISSQSPRTPR
jgi:hypothetical protein